MEEGKITIWIFEKVIMNHSIICLPKITSNTNNSIANTHTEFIGEVPTWAETLP